LIGTGEDIFMDTYICRMCGHIYDPAKGEAKPFKMILCNPADMQSLQCDPVLGVTKPYIPPGTPFSALPDDWVCPVCGYPKAYYQKQVPATLHSMRTIT
jgi:rubredoxin